ncbi:hypothetical protein PRK78_001401 [Emydomyces testavorans]|uniref:Protein kinase domain-containing protein n=1 Tax=Emydomyces testavorans TaxID=2070801 RepID=A0AAF0DCE9_9EURO|nr:hypothetical protein PRK78_001401 [Emydomyces testavorans]
MVVQLNCPLFNGCFVLKLYDRRFATQLRQDEEASPWNLQIESDYCEFVRNGRAPEFFDLCTAKFCEDEDWAYEQREKWNKAQHEAYLQYLCRRTYNIEKVAYDKLRDIQGKHVPRLFARILLQPSGPALANEYLDCPGILLEYIQGFPLTNLAGNASKKDFQYVCEDAIRVVHLIGDRGIINKDTKTRSFIVREDPVTKKFKVFMTDFGLCAFRCQAKDDREFNEWQADQDEEGAVGRVMERKLKGGFKYRLSARAWKLLDEFKSEE